MFTASRTAVMLWQISQLHFTITDCLPKHTEMHSKEKKAMKKKEYKTIQIVIHTLKTEDIITTSGNPFFGEDDPLTPTDDL